VRAELSSDSVREWSEVQLAALVYTLLSGLAEMLVLGTLYGLTLGPWG
jgi:hypothetical protein